jgi:hypothetical protein
MTSGNGPSEPSGCKGCLVSIAATFTILALGFIRACTGADVNPPSTYSLPQVGGLNEGQGLNAPCDYSSGLDALGRRCGGRAAEVIPGGALGGSGLYEDSDGNLRRRGPCNDAHDDVQSCYYP